MGLTPFAMTSSANLMMLPIKSTAMRPPSVTKKGERCSLSTYVRKILIEEVRSGEWGVRNESTQFRTPNSEFRTAIVVFSWTGGAGGGEEKHGACAGRFKRTGTGVRGGPARQDVVHEEHRPLGDERGAGTGRPLDVAKPFAPCEGRLCSRPAGAVQGRGEIRFVEPARERRCQVRRRVEPFEAVLEPVQGDRQDGIHGLRRQGRAPHRRHVLGEGVSEPPASGVLELADRLLGRSVIPPGGARQIKRKRLGLARRTQPLGVERSAQAQPASRADRWIDARHPPAAGAAERAGRRVIV